MDTWLRPTSYQSLEALGIVARLIPCVEAEDVFLRQARAVASAHADLTETRECWVKEAEVRTLKLAATQRT